ncbi:MAG: xanthine phosphoribosyltransferase [Clostridiales bacterium]|nr:xanthine phosphoribosyltransferase [Clostridiales bacterium]
MKVLKEKIIKEGTAIGTEILKVDSFLNHQMDIELMEEMGREFKRRFDHCKVDKILTVEASGIAIASVTARCFGYPCVVFAKKATPNTMTDDYYTSEAKSFTKGKVSDFIVSKKYLAQGEKVLIIDDFLASGEASLALTRIVEEAGANVVGIGIAVEKGFQGGGEKLRAEGYRLESLAVIEALRDGEIIFKEEQ